MAEQNNIQIVVSAKDAATRVFKGISESLSKFGEAAKSAALAVGAVGAAFTGAVFGKAITQAEAYREEMLRLEGVIAATGGAAGLTSADIDAMAKAANGSASEYRQAAAELLTFKSVTGDTFKTAMALSIDLAETGFGTVESAAVMMGKALENPVAGMGALGEAGVTFTDQQKEIIKSLVEAGDLARAQGIIIEAVAGQVGGVADAMGGTLGDAVENTGKRFEELTIQLGSATGPVFAGIVAQVGDLLGKLEETGVVKRFGDAIGGMASAASDRLVAFVQAVDWNQFSDQLLSAFQRIQQGFSVVTGSLGTGIATLEAGFYGLAGVLSTAVEWIVDGFAAIVQGQSKITIGPLRSYLQGLSEEIRAVGDSFGTAADTNFAKAEAALVRTEERAKDLRVAWAELNAPAKEYSARALEIAAAEAGLAKAEADYQAELTAATEGRQQSETSLVDYGEAVIRARENLAALTAAQSSNAIATKENVAEQQSATQQTGQAATQAGKLAAAQQQSANAYRAYAQALASGSADTAALGRAWQSAAAQAQSLQTAAQQTATGITAAKEAAAQAAVSSDDLSTAYQNANSASRAYNQAMADGAGDVNALRQAWMDAEKKLREMQDTQRKATQQPTEIKVETQGAEDAKAQIEGLAKPTESQHTVNTNVLAVLDEIDSLNGRDTSSTHTIYVKKVETNAIGGLVGLAQRFAGGGQAFPVPTWNTVPGVGNTDSVPASLASGAYVLRKAASAYYGTTLLDLIHRFASGGRVPSLLMPGERVFQPATVGRLGVGFFDALNRMTLPRDALAAHLDALLSPVRRFAAGGVVGAAASGSESSAARDSIDINLQLGARRVTVQGSRETAQSLATALRDLQRGL